MKTIVAFSLGVALGRLLSIRYSEAKSTQLENDLMDKVEARLKALRLSPPSQQQVMGQIKTAYQSQKPT